MAKQHCLKQNVNGHIISVAIDDNLCDKFRAEVVMFHSDNFEDHTEIGGSRCLTHMAELILEAEKIAAKTKGKAVEYSAASKVIWKR